MAPQNGVKDRYLVLLANDVASSPQKANPKLPTVAQLAQTLGKTHGGRVTKVWEHALQGFVVEMPEARARALADDDRVAAVEQDSYVSSPILACTSTVWSLNTRTLPSPTASPQMLTCSDPNPSNDTGSGSPLCPDNWGLDRIDQTSSTLNQQFSFTNNGTNVHVYVMDSGIRSTHREFQNASGVARMGTGVNTTDFPAPAAEDCYGHGTHVAGIIGGRTYGVAKNVTLHPVRILIGEGCDASSDVEYAEDAVEGLDWIVANVQRPAVVNWSGANKTTFSQNSVMKAAVNGLIGANIILVQSAGNKLTSDTASVDACSRSYGDLDGVIVVGGTNYADQRTTISNFGSCVDIWAPAEDVSSSFKGDDAAVCRLTGTSMAAPHVTGVVAAYLQSNPNATPAEVERALRSRGTWNALQSSSLGLHSDNVLLSSNTLSVGSDTAPVASFTYSCPGLQCVLTSTSTDDNGITSYAWSLADGTALGSGPVLRPTFTLGSKSVVLKVTDGTGKTDHVMKTFSVTNNDAPPTASFTYTCSVLTCTYDSSASTDVTTRSLDFGDNQTTTATSGTHTYANDGTYTAVLTITDAVGQTATDQKTITLVCPKPVFSSVTASPTKIVAGASISLAATTTATATFQWYEGLVGDTSTPVGSGANVSVSPNWSTHYWVRATNSCGYTNSTVVDIEVTKATSFYTMTPCRIVDTRGGQALAHNASRDLTVTGVCSIPSGARAVAANITAVSPTATGYLTFWPTGTNQPLASTMSYRSGKTRGNNAILGLSGAGKVSVYNNGASQDFIIDVYGYFQ